MFKNKERYPIKKIRYIHIQSNVAPIPQCLGILN